MQIGQSFLFNVPDDLCRHHFRSVSFAESDKVDIEIDMARLRGVGACKTKQYDDGVVPPVEAERLNERPPRSLASKGAMKLA